MPIPTSHLEPAVAPAEPSDLGEHPGHRACAHAVALEAIADAMHFDETPDSTRRERRIERLRAAARFLRNAGPALTEA